MLAASDDDSSSVPKIVSASVPKENVKSILKSSPAKKIESRQASEEAPKKTLRKGIQFNIEDEKKEPLKVEKMEPNSVSEEEVLKLAQ